MQNTVNIPQPVQQTNSEVLTTPRPSENKRIPVPEHIEPEPEQRGFWSHFFKPYG